MTYRALRTVYGDYGHKLPGEVFEVPDFMAREMEQLEASGVIERFRPPVNRKAFTIYENKMTKPAENKAEPATPRPLAPPVRKATTK